MTTPNEALRTILTVAGWGDTQSADVVFTGGADPALVHNRACTRKNGRVWRKRNRDYPMRELADRLIARVATNQEHCAAAKLVRRHRTLLEEITRGPHCR